MNFFGFAELNLLSIYLLSLQVMSDEPGKGEGGRQVEEEKGYRGISDKNTYFAKTISDFYSTIAVSNVDQITVEKND